MNIQKIMALIMALTLAACDISPTTTKPGATRTINSQTIPSNLKKVSYSELPGWRNDDLRYALQAFRNSCNAKIQYKGAVIPDRELFNEKCALLPSVSADKKTVREWFESHFQPYQVFNTDGGKRGTFTGYYAPVIPGCRTKTARCNEPLMAVPTDGRNYKGVPKTEIVQKQIGRVLYWANIVDVQNIQIQGSGLVELEDGKRVKLGFASVNDMPFVSIGKQLQERNIRPAGGFSSEAVWQHLRENPALAREVIYKNPRYVYFAEGASYDVVGKLGTPLSKIRSIAVDDSFYTLGLPTYVSTNLSNGTKFQRLMIAQDRGEAIKGPIRADIYFGLGDEAYKHAQGQHAQGEQFILMPKVYTYIGG